jgi:voltage-gated potassium channel
MDTFDMDPKRRLERWEECAEWPLALVALAFLADYSVDVLAQPHGAVYRAVWLIEWFVVAVFAADYVVRLILANDRRRWFVRHLFDLLIVTLPWFRPLRLVRLVVLISALQKAAGDAIRGRVAVYTVGGALLLVYVASLAVLEYERDATGSKIKTFPIALWWSVTTITTVGYGDVTPITVAGRLIAVGLMIGAIGLVGSITATLASWIVQRVGDEETTGEAVTVAHIDQLRTEIRALTQEVERNQQCKFPTWDTGRADLRYNGFQFLMRWHIIRDDMLGQMATWAMEPRSGSTHQSGRFRR